jgi:hypothetical protein
LVESVVVEELGWLVLSVKIERPGEQQFSSAQEKKESTNYLPRTLPNGADLRNTNIDRFLGAILAIYRCARELWFVMLCSVSSRYRQIFNPTHVRVA